MKKGLAVAAAAVVASVGFGVANLFTGSTADAEGDNCTVIGFQSGIAATKARLVKLDPGGSNASGTGAYDKLFDRTLTILVRDHDGDCAGHAPLPTTTSAPPTTTTTPAPRYNPQTYNKGSSGQDARYCVQFNDGLRYDSGGREIDGLRTGNAVAGLRPADEMNGKGPCDPYLGFPPWPAASYNR